MGISKSRWKRALVPLLALTLHACASHPYYERETLLKEQYEPLEGHFVELSMREKDSHAATDIECFAERIDYPTLYCQFLTGHPIEVDLRDVQNARILRENGELWLPVGFFGTVLLSTTLLLLMLAAAMGSL